MKRDSVVSALCLAVVLVCGGLVLIAGMGAQQDSPRARAAACAATQGCGDQARHAWMRGDAARRFASVFRE